MTDEEMAVVMKANNLLASATRIETEEGHLMQRSGIHWYAYPKLNPDAPGGGGEVIYESEGWPRKLKKFASVLDAYDACVEARARFSQVAVHDSQGM